MSMLYSKKSQCCEETRGGGGGVKRAPLSNVNMFGHSLKGVHSALWYLAPLRDRSLVTGRGLRLSP